MKNTLLQTTLQDLSIASFIQRADNATLARMIASMQSADTTQSAPEKLPRYALVYEKQGIQLFKRFITKQENAQREDIYACFQSAYICWRTLVFLPDEARKPVDGRISHRGLYLVERTLDDTLLSPTSELAFRLSVAGLLGARTAETRLDLTRFSLSPTVDPAQSWRHMVAEHIFGAFIRLVRKAGGWTDIQQALQSIATLREVQAQYEEAYLEQLADEDQQTSAAHELVGLYHLAQLVTFAGEYLQTGQPGFDKVNARLDRYYEQAVAALEEGQHFLLAHLADLLWAGCRELVQNAIWTHVPRLGQRIQEYVRLLTSSARLQPVIELWPSQQEALRRHLLDTYQRAILVEMPTSAGKTLLAKFAVIQTKALNPDGLIVYVVPTRALVNQVTLDFRMDFRSMLSVEQTVPVIELDPAEERLLRGTIDVLVTTPEKLDLLVRREHPVVKNIVLVVADEAHSIGDGERGARLELLLGTIKRDFTGARFLLLSPFLPNPQDLVQWLGDGQGLPAIVVDWKPNRKLVGAVQNVREQREWLLEFSTLNSVHAGDIFAGMKIRIGHSSTRLSTIHALSRATAHALVGRGSVLVLCKGPGTAVERAKEIAHERPLLPPHALLDAVCHYIEIELGKDAELITCLRHGVVYHHSGLSHETRWLIEELIRDRVVDIVCGTTTLAHGMNFPITAVIIETLQKGRAGKLSFQDFWNIAGRAGRTLVDTLGVIAFPAPTKAKHDQIAEFLRKEAEVVVSQLLALIEHAEQISTQFDLSTLRHNEHLSPLLQFLAHAMRVSGNEGLADEVEDLLRASLVYHQVQKYDQDAAPKLVRLCRAYLEQTRPHKSVLDLADQTGFATPSVLSLLAQQAQSQELTLEQNWLPERLFGADLAPLVERIQVIADLPEIRLGLDENEAFDAQRLAAILRDWVHGKTLAELAHLYGASKGEQHQQTIDFSRSLFSVLNRASWGIGALETVCLSAHGQIAWGDVGYVPSMLFFGVAQKEAIWFRMVGVPRVVAGGLAHLWTQRTLGEPGSYDALRTWVTQLSDQEWLQALPPDVSLTPQEMRLLWQSFSGGR